MSKKINSRDWAAFRSNLLKYFAPSMVMSISFSLLKSEEKSVIVTGGILIGVAIIWGLWLSLPSKKLNPNKFIGQTIKIEDVDNFFPELTKIAITGITGVGKSTFVNNFRLGNQENVRTQQIEVFVSSITNKPEVCFGILDGPGHSLADQFKIVGKAEIVLVFLDHNIANDDINIDEARLHEAAFFQEQLRNSLNQGNKKFKKIILVLNKMDIWANEIELQESKNFLKNWFQDQVKLWGTNYAEETIQLEYSNLKTNDFILLTKKIIL